MGKCIIILLLFWTNFVHATNHYISKSGNDANNGLTPATAWATLSKITALSVASGDSILLRSGDTWLGEPLPVPKANLHYSYYGAGASPKISGFTTLSGWTSSGNGKYSCSLTTDSLLNMVTIDGAVQIKGRYPNSNAADSGYLSHQQAGSSPVNNKIITTAGRYYVGCMFVMKANDWRIQTVIATNIVNAGAIDTVTFTLYYFLGLGTTDGLEPAKGGFGDFKQARNLRDTTLLDQYGEWVYDQPSNKFYIYLGATDPNSVMIKAATTQVLMNNTFFSGTTVDGLAFEGGNLYGILGSSCQNISITNCKFNNMGATATGWYRLFNSEIKGNTFSNCNQMAIYVRSSTSPYSNINISYNTITRVGQYAGMGGFNNNGDYCAIAASAYTGLDISYNNISYTGIDPIRWQGSEARIHHNWIFYFNYRAQDKAGIYNYWDQISPNSVYYYDRQVDSNFISYAIGSINGTPSTLRRSSAIYMDGVNKNVRIFGNVCWNFARKMVNLNIRDTTDVHDNIGIPGDSSIFLNATVVGVQQQQNYTIHNFNCTRNTGYAYASTQSLFYYENGAATSATIQATLRNIGVLDSNYFNFYTFPCWRVLIGSPYGVTSRNHSTFATYSLFGVNDFQQDDLPKSSTLLLTNYSPIANTFDLNGVYVDVEGNSYSGSTVLQPYTGLFLMLSSEPPPVIYYPKLKIKL